MNLVFQRTRELGEALLQSDEYLHMKKMERIAMANQDAAMTMGQYIEKKQQMEELLLGDEPDSEQLKRLSQEMDSLQEHLQLIDDVRVLTEARDGFSALIEQVNSVLRFIITGQMEDDDSGCSGGCSGCHGGGCHSHIN